MKRVLLAMALCALATSARAGDEEVERLLQALEPSGELPLDARDDERQVLALLDSHAGGSAHATGRSRGRPQDGSLLGGRQLPGHPGFRIRSPERAWASPATIGWILEGFDAVLAADPLSPAVMIHDLSLQHGGPMSGHGSHQSGRDVDIMYYQRSCPDGICRARSLRPGDLDARRQWLLLRHWLRRGLAEFIFVSYPLQEPLYEEAKGQGASQRQLRAWFQWPRGPEHPAGVVRHWPKHANHLHVRFRCAPGDADCLGPAASAEPAAAAESGCLSLLDDPGELPAELGWDSSLE